MARTVFFSFHYDPDWSRMWVVRNSGQFKNDLVDSGTFRSRDRWETVRRQSSSAIKSWIDEGLKYSGVTVVLIGQDTWRRDWVRYEVEESERQGMGMLGVYVHNVKDLSGNYGAMGPNPFYYADVSKSYSTYDWSNNRGYDNFSSWVEQAATDAGR